MIKGILGKDNKTVKFIKSLQTSKGRKKGGCFFAEGERAVSDSVATAAERVRYIVFSETYKDEKNDFAEELEKKYSCFFVPDKVFCQLCETETPQGILAVFEIPEEKDFDFKNDVLVLDSVADPGNMGTIIRTAEAMGFFDIVLLGSCADVYSPKVVRSTMGAVLRTRFLKGSKEDLDNLKSKGYKLYSTALCENSLTPENVPVAEKRALIIGNEANGISKEVLEISDYFVKIPMHGKIESLNAAVAAAIVMYNFSLKRKSERAV